MNLYGEVGYRYNTGATLTGWTFYVKDCEGNVLLGMTVGTPASSGVFGTGSGLPGFGAGCVLMNEDAVAGASIQAVNTGSKTSSTLSNCTSS